MKITPLVTLVCFTCTFLVSGEALSESVSKYSGQQAREIKSLSQADIKELKRGGGWGLAKPAELNGLPGPSHVLEMKDDLHLDEKQISEITDIFNRMNSRAVYISKKFIKAEQHLDYLFKTERMNETKLLDVLKISSKARQELRYIHLAAHLKTSRLLSGDQIQSYNSARGYIGSEKCKITPKGHDVELWKKHNGCR